MTRRAAERRLAWALCLPAVGLMLAVSAYPIAHAFWLSLHRYDLRFPAERGFVGLANYLSVLGSEVWWRALGNTLMITIGSVVVELILGMALALWMHRTFVARHLVRASILVPYAIITVVAALAWKFAFDPTTGFINGLLGSERAWLSQRGSAFFVIIATEVWKTTPFVALLLLAGLSLIPIDVLHAARMDGASALQRFWRISLPLLRPAIGVALLFRTLDAFRIFDTVFIQTRGAQDTESVSMLGYQALIVRLNLGLGSAVSILIFLGVVLIAFVLVRGFGMAWNQDRHER